MRKWRCTVCGYIHLGFEPPEVCPVCGAGREAFVDAGPAEETAGLPVEIWQEVSPVLRRIAYSLLSSAQGMETASTAPRSILSSRWPRTRSAWCWA